MAGNTAIISVAQFRADWDSHIPISSLCERYTVTKDQVLRLKIVWKLTPRMNRALRAKPKWSPRPDKSEDEASGSSCDLAPAVARRVEELRRGVGGPQIFGVHVRSSEHAVPFTLKVIPDPRAIIPPLGYDEE